MKYLFDWVSFSFAILNIKVITMNLSYFLCRCLRYRCLVAGVFCPMSHVLCLRTPMFFFCLLFPVPCLLIPVLAPIFWLMFPVPCPTYFIHVFCFVSFVPCFLSCVFCPTSSEPSLLSYVFRLLSQDSWFLSLLLSSVSCFLSLIASPMSPVPCSLSPCLSLCMCRCFILLMASQCLIKSPLIQQNKLITSY